jgi:hypothetical protein
MSRRNGNTRWTSAIGAALLVGALLLSASLAALPAGGLALQATDLTTMPAAQGIELAEQRTPGPQTTPQPPTTPGAGGSSVLFIENAGQWDPGARFQVWGGPAGTVWLAQDAIWVVVASGTSHPADGRRPVIGSEAFADLSADLQPADLQPATLHAIKLSFVGANPQPRMEAFDPQETLVSYFLGNDPEQWRPDVPVWGGVRYVNLYPGVDLELSGEHGRLAPRLTALTGADLSAVRLRVEGSDAVAVDGGTLRLSTAAGEVVWPLLNANGIEVGNAQAEPSGVQVFDVAAPFVPANSQQPANGDNQRFPSDNPADLLYGTFLGGNSHDYGHGIAVDRMGNAYVTGSTESPNFPTTPGAFDPTSEGYADAFVVKLNPAGSGLAYATFLGGISWDSIYAIDVDGAGSAYVTGLTQSSNFPATPDAFDTSHNGGTYDTFVAKLNPAGSELAYATFLGGSGLDYGYGIAVDEAGSAYVTGETRSSNFPTTSGAFDTSFGGGDCGPYLCGDAFVVKLNSTGSSLIYATFLGGSGNDNGSGIVVDGTGCAYATGSTDSPNFPTTSGAFDTSYNGRGDAFIIKLTPAGNGLTYATFLGSNQSDSSFGIAIDGMGSAHVTGSTKSSSFPTTPGAFDTSHAGGTCTGSGEPCPDAFVVKLTAAGSGLAYSTFLGGRFEDEGRAIALDGTGNAYVTGYTESNDFPTTPDAFDRSYDYHPIFVAKLNMAGTWLLYSTFLGGHFEDDANDIALDGMDSAFLTGHTTSSDFPRTPGSFDVTFDSSVCGSGYSTHTCGDAFAVRLAMGESGMTATPTATPTRTPTPTTPPAPALDPIVSPGANPSYRVEWNAVTSATAYVLERASSADFSNATQVYNGAVTTYTAPCQGITLYYYRVKAHNQWGDSAWSNVQSVEVRWEQEPNYPMNLANGPLISSLDHYGYPNDGDDYFFFQVANRGQVTIDLTNHSATGVQIVLRNPTGSAVAMTIQPPYRLVYTAEPGVYYIQIYSAGGYNSTTPYMLRATFPWPTPTPSPTATITRTPTPMPPRGYLPLVLHRFPPIPDTPVLNGITAPGANPSYTVRWNASQSATSYLLQRATSASFADAVQVYSGAATTYSAPSQGIARYHYRVQARNQYGNSPWSNVQWVDVRWEQEPNYPLANANGPLLSGLNYYGYPNDTDDYFYFQVASRGQVTIDLTNHSDQSVQLLLRTPAGDPITFVNQPPYHLVATVDPGRYYVHIYATGGFNTTTPYTLRAVFP